ncbi:hypothetical protein F5Y19DRAFT_483137 [Xylariaceae sp. FL1651]|nr:hypothetical protein F5Y19DRAFT_483137 [Xylariaceae sp. FL1651]
MGVSILTTLQILGSLGIRVILAQRLAYTTFAVTECITREPLMHSSGAFPPSVVNTAPEALGDPGNNQPFPTAVTVSYTMPPCIYCDCPGCTLLSSFITTYPAFCTEGAFGMKTQSYAITETYLGLFSLPRFEKPTHFPFGFVARLETCEAGKCGSSAIVATMTYPAGGRPFVDASTPVQTGISGCSGQDPGSGVDCSTLSTQYTDMGNPGTTAAPAPASAPAQPTAVTAGGSLPKRPLEVLVILGLFLAAL